MCYKFILLRRFFHRAVLLAFALSGSLIASSQTLKQVNGRVTNEEGNPLTGVTVFIEGTTVGTTTDVKGSYSLVIPNKSDTIAFSYIGFESQKIPIDNKHIINVRLLTNAAKLNSVVVIGYGTQSRADVTTSISKLDNNVLKNIPYSNVASALEGTIPGLRVQSTSGQPGAEPRIILRGGTSINNPNGATPLYVIDGVISDNMNDVNPTDIKSVQVLKDAAATAIYGARGSNGVIIITTKTGRPGKTQVNYNFDLTVSKVGKTYNLLNAKQFVYYQRLGIAATASLNPAFSKLLTGSTYAGGTGNDLTNNTYLSLQYLTPENAYKLKEGWESEPDPLDPSKTLIFSNTNWQDLLYRTAISQNHSLSVSGGSQNATYRLGLGYQNDEGIAIQTNYKRFNIDFDGGLNINSHMKIYSQVKYNTVNNEQVYSIGNIFESAVIQPPTDKLYFEDGSLSPGRNLGYSNPIYAMSTYNPKNIYNNLTLIGGGSWEIIPGLTFAPQVSYSQNITYERNFQKAFWNGVAVYNTLRTASGSFAKTVSPQATATLTYIKSIHDAHNIQAMAGFSYFESDNTSLSATGNGAATDLIPTLNASAVPVSVSGSENSQRIVSYFSRVLYNYKQKYLLNLSLRYDGASNLGANNKWGLFPAVSAGWWINKEPFWKIFPSNLFSLKLRASYGVTGNISGLGLYEAEGEYSTSARYAENSAIEPSVLPNPNLKWEQSQTFDAGFDLGIFNDRINITFDHYRRITNNLLTTLSMPPSTGFSSIITNYGSLGNTGYEFQIGANILSSSSQVQWNVSFNYANVNTRIIKLPPNGQKNNRVGGVYIYVPKDHQYEWKGGLQQGGRIGDLYGYKQVGIYPTDKAAQNAPYDEFTSYKTKEGGDVDWLDVDGNDTIDTRDQVYMGNPYPRVTGGITNTLSYKGFTLYVRTDYTLGATVYYELGARLEGNFSGSNNLSTDILKSWQKQGDITNIPRYYWADQDAKWNVWDGRPNSRFFESTNFLCIREVTVSYNLSQGILKRYKIPDLRLHVTGNNLYYFTKYQGLNPEEPSTDVAYPVPRNIIFGASVTF